MRLRIDAISPVMPVALLLSQERGIDIFEAGDLVEPYTVVGDNGLLRFKPEADLPPWLLDAIRRAMATAHPRWLE